MFSDRIYTVDDLARFPENDGNRYELIEGSLYVTPTPLLLHQYALGNLNDQMRRACPPDRLVLFAPMDVIFSDITVLEPDLLVVRSDIDFTDWVREPPLLTVEVLSPSTRSYDRLKKWNVYKEYGVGAYWIVDPNEPSITAWTWVDGDEAEVVAVGDEPLEVTFPFPATVVPADLVRR